MKVLLASDGSENALEAAKFLLRLAPATPLEVTVVSVSFEPGHPRNSAVQPWYPEWVTREKERFSTHQDVIKKLFEPTGRPVHGVHRFGDPVPSLLQETQQLEPDLVVLGAKGHSAIHRLLLGSTSDSVATHVGCSVVVVRGKHDAAGTSPSAAATAKPLKLLLAYDGSSGSQEAVAEQLQIGWPESTEVQLVSVAAHAYAFFDDTYAAMAAAYESEEVERVRLEAERMCGTIASRFANTT